MALLKRVSSSTVCFSPKRNTRAKLREALSSLITCPQEEDCLVLTCFLKQENTCLLILWGWARKNLASEKYCILCFRNLSAATVSFLIRYDGQAWALPSAKL